MTNTKIYSIYHARGPHADYDATVLVQYDSGEVIDVKNFGTISAFDAAQIVRFYTCDEVTVSRISATAFKKLHSDLYTTMFA